MDALKVNGVLCNRRIKEIAWIIESNNTAKQVYELKFKEFHKMIDLKVRLQFHSTMRSTVKCIICYDYYGNRYKKLN